MFDLMRRFYNPTNHVPRTDRTLENYCCMILWQHSKYSFGGSSLPENLVNNLERLPLSKRRELANQYRDKCTPFFLSCLRGQVKLANYLIVKCGVDIEQQLEVAYCDIRTTTEVNALWCAAISGRLSLVKLLIEKGANVNPYFRGGEATPVSIACAMSHLSVVQYLVKRGANINIKDSRGTTCLMNAVMSTKLCRFLIKRGADVHAKDYKGKTALHYAVEMGIIDTVKLLIENGADIRAKNAHGDDPLQRAIIKGDLNMVDYLYKLLNIQSADKNKCANVHELMAATYIFKHDLFNAISKFTHASDIRNYYNNEKDNVPKIPKYEPRECFLYEREFSTKDELINLIEDEYDTAYIQGLLVSERILGPNHSTTLKRMMHTGSIYSKHNEIYKCINLWKRVLQIRVKENTVLSVKTTKIMHTLIDYIVDKFRQTDDNIQRKQRLKIVNSVFEILLMGLYGVKDGLRLKPQCKLQVAYYEVTNLRLRQLIYVMLQMVSNKADMELCKINFTRLLNINMECVIHGGNGLHICVLSHKAEHESIVDFLDTDIASNETCGCVDWALPLLEAPGTTNITVPNFNNYQINTSRVLLQPLFNINFQLTVNKSCLQCLAAKTILKHKIDYKNIPPKHVEQFVNIH